MKENSALKKRVGIWIRVSTEDQARGESPAHHLERAKAYAVARGWTVKEDSDAKVVLYLLHHGVEATVTFLISEEEIEAYCVAFAVDKEGNHKKPEQPTNWLGNLKKDITKSLTVAMAPERK